MSSDPVVARSQAVVLFGEGAGDPKSRGMAPVHWADTSLRCPSCTPVGRCNNALSNALADRDVLSGVIKELSAEFGDQIDVASITRVATQEVALFDGAKVRNFIPMIAWRLARFRLLEQVQLHRSAPELSPAH